MPRPPLSRMALALLTGLALAGLALAALADPPHAGFAPDPPAQASRKQWSVEVSAQSGKLTATRAVATTLDKPQPTPRVVGRFALELYVGPELLDRARFTLPLLDAPPDDANKGRLRRPSFEQVTTRVHVRIADSPRAAYLVLTDRATGDSQRFDWPPEADGSLLAWKAGRLADGGAAPSGKGAGTRVAEVSDVAEARDGGAGDAAPRDAARE